jgi:NAD(P)-dependent dehydrogenase (short-subunit alcohol dehydrogenase family)
MARTLDGLVTCVTTSNGKVVIITGAGSGIGAATAKLLADRGDRVLMVGRDLDRLTRARVQLGSAAAEVLAADVTADGAGETVVRTAIELWGRVDVLVNNAGINRAGDLATLSMSDFDATFAVNVRAPYALTRAAVGHMRPGSSIVFVGSNLSRYGKPGASAYAASKAAVESLTRTLAVELGGAGIRVNAVSPGMTHTGMTAASFADEERYRQLVANSPVGFLGEPEDIASTIAFLTSDASRYVNGASLVIDGGRSLI